MSPREAALVENIETKDLTPELWPAFEKLFGKNGACGGCWCMAWRIEKGERWDEVKGPTAKRRMRTLVTKGKALGVLAFAGNEPVGWCAYGPRADFPKLDRARTLTCDDAERVWSIPCFFVKNGWRGKGVATALLKHALQSLRQEGAEIAEGYPVKPSKGGGQIRLLSRIYG
jgi:predicted GNAT family acetyltransferase